MKPNGTAGGLRATLLGRLADEPFDVLVLGGGINGAASAAALARGGARVALIDARDFAGFTSQHSSNFVWGGIKYMEGFEFGLVAGLCRARNELMRAFPSTVKEIRFLTTVDRGFRHHPRLLWAGAWLYWLMGRAFTQPPRSMSARAIGKTEPRIDLTRCAGGIEYSDAYLHDNDARFVFNFVRDALDHHAVALNYVSCDNAERSADGFWHVDATDQSNGAGVSIRARVLVNATGAFVDDLNARHGVRTRTRHVLSKGIHLLVPKISAAQRILAFFASDGRLFFAIPMANRTCVGTTDTRVDDPHAIVTDEDRAFVLDNINQRLSLDSPLEPGDVIAERCGVRPLAVRGGDSDASDFLQLSRHHIVEVDADQGHVSVFGGKLTDCVNVGEEVRDAVAGLGVHVEVPAGRWYGEPDAATRDAFLARAVEHGLDGDIATDTGERLSTRLWRRYGARANDLLDTIIADPELATPVVPGMGLRWCEIDHMREHELVASLDDVLRRRSKIAQLVPADKLEEEAGVRHAAERLFGNDGTAQYAAWVAEAAQRAGAAQ